MTRAIFTDGRVIYDEGRAMSGDCRAEPTGDGGVYIHLMIIQRDIYIYGDGEISDNDRATI